VSRAGWRTGKLADLVILDRDPRKVAPRDDQDDARDLAPLGL
jgi:hypothetical protein